MKLFMIPHTVPNSPMNGDVAPTVASMPMPKRTRRDSERMISVKLDAARSLMPASLSMSDDWRSSLIAVATNVRMTLLSDASADEPSVNVRTLPAVFSARTSLRLAMSSSTNFAMKIVQVISDAKAKPAMIVCTTRLAERNIDQGDNSRIPTGMTRPMGVAAPDRRSAPAAASSAHDRRIRPGDRSSPAGRPPGGDGTTAETMRATPAGPDAPSYPFRCRSFRSRPPLARSNYGAHVSA